MLEKNDYLIHDLRCSFYRYSTDSDEFQVHERTADLAVYVIERDLDPYLFARQPNQKCGDHMGVVPESSSAKIRCSKKTAGRYVFIRNGENVYESRHMALCEVVVMGYVPLDCSGCAAGGCDDYHGCKVCPVGHAKPDCKRCEGAFYGSKCDKECYCRRGGCDNTTGVCDTGCADWWTEPQCNVYISEPNMTHVLPDVSIVSTTSVEVIYEQLDINETMTDYYGYVVEYKTTDTDFVELERTRLVHVYQAPVTEGPTTLLPTTEAPNTTLLMTTEMDMNVTMGNNTSNISMTSTTSPMTTEGMTTMETTTEYIDLLPNNRRRVLINGLAEGVQYSFRVRPYREIQEQTWNNNRRTEGTPSKEIHIKLQSINVLVTKSTAEPTTTTEREIIITEPPEYDILSKIRKRPAIPVVAIVILVIVSVASAVGGVFIARHKYFNPKIAAHA